MRILSKRCATIWSKKQELNWTDIAEIEVLHNELASKNDAGAWIPLNNIAFLIAKATTSTEIQLDKALSFATMACESTVWKAGGAIDTLAFVYHQKDDLENAVKYQKMAKEIATPDKKADYALKLLKYEKKLEDHSTK